MKRHALTVALVCCLLAGGAQAQFTQDPGDSLAADTIDVEFLVGPDATTNQLKVELGLFIFNDGQDIIGISAGFSWLNPNMTMDSAVAEQFVDDGFDAGTFFYEDGSIATTNANDRFLFGAARIFGAGVPAGPSRRLWVKYYFTLDSWSVNDSIVIDTNTFSNGSILKFVGDDGSQYQPFWGGRVVYRDSAFTQPSNLVLSEDTLFFTGQEDGTQPPPQVVTITSDFDPLVFSLTEDAPWLLKSPTSGSTPEDITVSVNTTGLTQGTYFDSIAVTSGDAANSPQFIYVELEVTPPPPVIDVDPTSLTFNAIAGDPNPPPKTLTIKNTGGLTLNWTATNSEPWLLLSPSSGTDSTDVSVSVDITGLAFGDYFDTVVVSDPAAENDPVRVPVRLTVASDLPIIAFDIPNLYIVDPVDRNDFTLKFLVFNEAGGTMTYTASENSTRILTVDNNSGLAPDSVTVNLRVPSAVEGSEFVDTVIVSSPEAINSPQAAVLRYRFTSDPAVLSVNADTVSFDLFECYQGYGALLPQFFLEVSNSGGDDPIDVAFEFESDLFSVNPDIGPSQFVYIITPKITDLTIGTYYDTITFTSTKAVNSPYDVILQYNVVEAVDPPELLLTDSSLDVRYPKGYGARTVPGLTVLNRFGGCLDWFVGEFVPGVDPTDSSGTIPSLLNFSVNAEALPNGYYPDTMIIEAPDATNGSAGYEINLFVYQYRGDVNMDGVVNISDLTALIQYLNLGGDAPLPEVANGDVNCDGTVDIADLTAVIQFLFLGGDPPCNDLF